MKREPNNPNGLTAKELNLPSKKAQWRFLDKDEIKQRQFTSHEIQGWLTDKMVWSIVPCWGNANNITYRTKLSRKELAKLP